MFGGEVHLRTYAQLQRYGIAPYLGRLGLEPLAAHLQDVQFEFVGLATHTAKSAQKRLDEFRAPGLSFEFAGAVRGCCLCCGVVDELRR